MGTRTNQDRILIIFFQSRGTQNHYLYWTQTGHAYWCAFNPQRPVRFCMGITNEKMTVDCLWLMCEAAAPGRSDWLDSGWGRTPFVHLTIRQFFLGTFLTLFANGVVQKERAEIDGSEMARVSFHAQVHDSVLKYIGVSANKTLLEILLVCLNIY